MPERAYREQQPAWGAWGVASMWKAVFADVGGGITGNSQCRKNSKNEILVFFNLITQKIIL